MTRLDVDFVRGEFPAFTEPSLAGFAHFENAGGSYACRQTIERLERFYRQTKVQPYYAFAPSQAAGAAMDAAKSRFAAWLNVGADELHFGPSTSQNTYVLAQALREHLSAGDEVVVTNQDHEANVGAWRRLASAGIVVKEWQVDRQSGELRIAGLESLLGPRTRVVAFTHCSNVLATINPVREITELVHRAGAWAFVDGVSWAPHSLPDLAALGVDAYFFSLYKVYGPHLGAMFLRRELNGALPNQGHFFNEHKAGYRFTPAGPDHAQIAAVNGVVDYLETVARHHGLDTGSPAAQAAAVGRMFRAHEERLLQPLLDRWSDHPQIRLLGRSRATERAPTVAFAVVGRRPGEVAERLGAAGIGVGAGNFYGYRLVQALGFDPEEGVLRASFVHYTSMQEVERLMDAVDAC